ncbi:MAG: acyl-CoA dehydrogenase family protein, partial [Candidatus Hydrogenedentota bacterium]
MFTDEQKMTAEMARNFAQEKLAPGAAAREQAGEIELSVREEMGQLGLLGMTVDPDWGGVGADYLSYALAIIEIAAGDGAVSTMMSVQNAPVNAILSRYGSDEQKERFLRPLARGEYIGAFALTEANAGSDASAIRTRAILEGDHYVINGSKQFITSGKIAGATILF